MADEPAFTFTDQIRPVCEIGMSDVREAEPDTWLDVSCHVHEVEIFRGRERFSDHFMPATASITFDNRSGWGDLVGAPLIVAGQTLRPARPIRVGVSGVFDDDTVESTRWLYRGWIDQATPAYDPVLHDVVTVNCIDAFGEAGQSVAPQGAEQGINETVTARVNRVLDAVGWFPAKRKMATVSTTVQGTPLGSRAVDLMTAAADSAGGVVFGDLDGDVVLKGIDWMLYDPDDPPDGEIGNMDPGEPELEDVPVYVDPGEGTVYDPDPPPMERPPIVQFCVRAEDPLGMISGTIVEQGDSWVIFAMSGHLWYSGSGRTWDMGEFDGQGCTTVYPPGDDPDDEPPERVDECPEGLFWDVVTETCVEEPECPEGEVWSPTFEECVPECPEGQVYDLALATCVPECPEGQWWDSDLETCVDDPTCPEGQEWVHGYDAGACVDVTPVPPPDVPAPGPGPGDPPPDEGDPVDSLFTVELLGWDDGGVDDDPASHIDPITITPGTDCLLVVLVNAINTDANSGLLVAAVNGGGLNWSHRRNADQAGEGAPSFIVLTEVGRDDPGTFNVQVDWAAGMTTRSHIATVWRVKNAVDDYVDKFDAGLVLYATVDSNPPEEVQPGDGPQTVTMVADDPPVGFPALPRAVDITIAQSLAEEETGPFGAIFDETNGPWNYPPNAPAQPAPTLLIGEWIDDFERADGALGADWQLGPGPNWADQVEPFTIVDGAAEGTVGWPGGSPHIVNMMQWVDPQGADQVIEVELEDVWAEGYVQLYTNGNDVDGGCQFADFLFSSDTGQIVIGVFQHNHAGDDWGTTGSESFNVTHAPSEPIRARLESDADGTQRVYIDDVLAGTWVDPDPIVGTLVGVGVEYPPLSQSPRILRASGGSLGANRKASWVAAWRQGVTYADVVLEDVNVGEDDIQSAQAALVLESAEVDVDDFPVVPYGPITIGGATDPYNGLIDYIGLFDPVTGEPILRFP